MMNGLAEGDGKNDEAPTSRADVPSPQLSPSSNLPGHPQQLTDQARGYVEAASSINTRKAYASDLKHFSAWCHRSNLSPLLPHAQTVGLYITACASGRAERGMKANSVATIERRLSSIYWNYAQRGLSLDRKGRHVAMLEMLHRATLRGVRDRTMLLIVYAGGLRRSEIVGLDFNAEQTEDGRGWIEIIDKGMLVTLRGKTGWREVEIGRGSSDAHCPVAFVETWIKFAKLAHGPLFRRVTGQGKSVRSERLNDKEIACMFNRTAMAAGIRRDLAEIERRFRFSGHSLRAGFGSSPC